MIPSLCRMSALLLSGVVFLGPVLAADLPGPPPPKQYQAKIRYQIHAARNDRIAQFFELVRFLEALGFQKEPGAESEPEDPSEVFMSGVIGSADARKLLGDRRVKALLLVPEGFKLPDEADQPVKVQLDLATGFPPATQKLLADQSLGKLRRLGFREKVGYDHHGFTRLVGTVPAGQLETLLKDLRWQPAGWLLPDDAQSQLPSPLKAVSPIRVVQVVPEPAGVAAAQEPPAAPAKPEKGREFLAKISPDLRALAGEEAQQKPARMEIFLNHYPGVDDASWRRALTRVAPDIAIEGRLGPLVTAQAYPRQAPAIAALPFVSALRLPRPAASQLPAAVGAKDRTYQALRDRVQGRVDAYRYQGRGGTVLLIGGDFRGYDQFLGKRLPANTRFIDLTAERNPSVKGDESPKDVKGIGQGTQMALDLGAVGAHLILLRVDPAAPHMIEEIARFIHGEPGLTDSLKQRRDEMLEEHDLLQVLRENLLAERKKFLENFGRKPDTDLRKPEEVEKEVEAQRNQLFKRQNELDAREKELIQRNKRFLQLLADLQSLKNVQIVLSSLTWNDGHPVAGSGPMSRHFDDKPFKAARWFQAQSALPAQTWTGLFRDADNNGVMEFAPADAKLGRDRWSHELNFLAWQPFGKEKQLELPAKAQVRVTLQWREAHDPAFHKNGEDLYLQPLVTSRLVVLRQRDSRGQKLPVDDLEVAAVSSGLPQRLDNRPNSATYEVTAEFTAEPNSRYVLRVESQTPSGTRPADTATLPAYRKDWELRPRIFVDVLQPEFRDQGRPIFLDYAAAQPFHGTPGDALSVTTPAPGK